MWLNGPVLAYFVHGSGFDLQHPNDGDDTNLYIWQILTSNEDDLFIIIQ